MTGDKNELFIGIDAGTTLIKSVLFDMKGNELKVARQSVPIESPRPGYQEQDMGKVWEAAKSTLKEIIGPSEAETKRIKAIGITGQGAGCWLIDREGNPVRNAILWSDGRAASIINDWVEKGINDKVYRICGSIQYSGCQGAIMKWLSIHEPHSLKAAYKTLWVKDWIKFKLSGDISTDPSDSSISFLDMHRLQYDYETMELMGIGEYKDLLPKIRSCQDGSVRISPDIARELNLPEGIRIVNTPFDMMASTIGVGAVSDGDACSILGTALISQVVLDKPALEPFNVGFTICYGIPGRWVRSMAAMMGTPNLDWFIDAFCRKDAEEAEKLGISIFEYLDEIVGKIPPGSQGIVYHPYLSPAGERSPFINENAKAQFIGLSQDHTRHHVLRAIYEGVALAVRHSYEAIPGKVEKVSLSGGGAKSPVWCQIISDMLNAKVRVPSGSEFGAKGAAMNAAVAVGAFDSYGEAVGQFIRFDREYAPDTSNHEKYNRLYEIYVKTYESMTGIWGLLAGFKADFDGLQERL